MDLKLYTYASLAVGDHDFLPFNERQETGVRRVWFSPLPVEGSRA